MARHGWVEIEFYNVNRTLVRKHYLDSNYLAPVEGKFIIPPGAHSITVKWQTTDYTLSSSDSDDYLSTDEGEGAVILGKTEGSFSCRDDFVRDTGKYRAHSNS